MGTVVSPLTTGNLVDGDKIMYICGKSMEANGRLKKDTVVTTVMSNLGMYKALESHGMKSVKTKVGDRYVVEEMLKNGYNLGGNSPVTSSSWITTRPGTAC